MPLNSALTLLITLLSYSPASFGIDLRSTPPSGITGISEQTLTKAETYGGMTLPAGTRIKTISDGTILSIELLKPMWIKGYPARHRVEFYPNTMLRRLVLSEDLKIEGKTIPAGTTLEFTEEGFPKTPESLAVMSACKDAQEKMESWISATAPLDCKTDSDCMLQTIAPYACGVPIGVAKPGFPASKREELKKFTDAYVKACRVPAPNTITCEQMSLVARCKSMKCSAVGK